MATFAPALAWVLPHEGGWSDRATDPGGKTNFGITLATYLGLGRLVDLDGDGVPEDLDLNHDGLLDGADLALLTPELAGKIYEARYWRKIEPQSGLVLFDLGLVESQQAATKIFDMGVNMGPGQACKYAQQVVNLLGVGLTVDGALGPKTVAAINNAPSAWLVEGLVQKSLQHYEQWIAQKPGQREEYRRGLMRRARAVPE